MSLLQILIVAVVVSLVIWLARTYLPYPISMVVIVLTVLFVCVWLLQLAGLANLHLGLMHGPSVPPDPWEGVRLASC